MSGKVRVARLSFLRQGLSVLLLSKDRYLFPQIQNLLPCLGGKRTIIAQREMTAWDEGQDLSVFPNESNNKVSFGCSTWSQHSPQAYLPQSQATFKILSTHEISSRYLLSKERIRGMVLGLRFKQGQLRPEMWAGPLSQKSVGRSEDAWGAQSGPRRFLTGFRESL